VRAVTCSEAPGGVPLVLASSSPRRRRLLRELGVPFAVAVPDVDERALPGETPRDHVRRLAAAKARAVARSLRAGIVIGSDTVVAVDGEILGKPKGRRDAERMLAHLAGRTHEVWSGVAVVRAGGGRPRTAAVRTRVTMKALDPGTIRRYVATGEPLDKAGSYAVQGRARRFVERVDGDLTNVVGLPLAALARLLVACGVTVTPPSGSGRSRRTPRSDVRCGR
jgi:septum formation protein